MSDKNVPPDAPPSYDFATASSSTRPPAAAAAAAASSNSTGGKGNNSFLGVSGRSGSIPSSHRRSMEDENRPLPEGWIRSFDPQAKHQFFVDTARDPPRSIWVHPYDDDEYLRTLSSEERERIEQESMGRGHPPSKADLVAEHTDEEDDHGAASASASAPHHDAGLPPRPDGKGKKPLGRKLKDKLTGTTHEQRMADRQKRQEEEQRMYEQHQRMREAMAQAQQTGQPVHVGKDRDGKDIYVEPPAYNGGPGYGGGVRYNPYDGGVYTTPNARYIRPTQPYGRPYGSGYGGGYGLPLAVGGGLLGGMLLGDLAFGGMGGGFGGGGFGM